MLLLFALAGFGCSEDSPRPGCANCEAWDQIVTDLGRQAVSHPTDPDFIVYGTIRKTPGSSDAERQADEDLWLLWRGSADPAQWVRWQLTGDEIATTGDNFQARWSPSGTQIVFVHSSATGKFEVWKMDVALPPSEPPSASFDPRGPAERISTEGRDPAWLDESRILFVRNDKLFLVDAATGSRGEAGEVQITFDPPGFVNAESFVDRHPSVTSDGIAIFSTVGRQDVGDLLVAAFEVSMDAVPETTATRALLGMQSPGAPIFVYPLFDGPDTLVTPADEQNPYLRFRSLPIGADGVYSLGVRRDAAFFPPTEETYCDTLLTKSVTLSTGAADTLRFYFQIARGTLVATSGRPNTQVTWERLDGLASGPLGLVSTACQFLSQECLLTHQVDPFGNIIPNSLEPYLVIGRTNTGIEDSIQVTLARGESTFVKLFCEADTCGCVLPTARRPLEMTASRIEEATRSRSTNDSRGGDLRAVLGGAAISRIDLANPSSPVFTPLVSAEDLEESLQTPVLSPPFAGGSRFLAYASNRTGNWGLYVQKLDANLNRVGEPVLVETPGSSDNYVCTRNIFHPSWSAGSSPGSLKLLVTMTSCPDNGFSDLGFDDDPWSQGELNVWEVTVPLQ